MKYDMQNRFACYNGGTVKEFHNDLHGKPRPSCHPVGTQIRRPKLPVTALEAPNITSAQTFGSKFFTPCKNKMRQSEPLYEECWDR